jgi:MoaA/NifB/PqqE/SkfB family radical SAM enzyme
MSIDRFLLECRAHRRLLALLFELTYACDLRCPFCYNEKERRGRPLSFEDYARIFGEGREEGALYLTLSGGEPTLHPRFFEIGKQATALGYSVRIKTNGHGLNEAALVRIRQEIDPYNLDVSIHGASPGTHDAATGIPDSFARLGLLVDSARAIGLRVRLKFPLTRRNEHEVTQVFALARSWGLGLDPFAEITPHDTGNLEPVQMMASLDGIRAMYREHARAGARPDAAFLGEEEQDRMRPAGETEEFACGAGLTTLCVDPFGAVYPCVGWRRPAGDLHEKSLKEIWRDLPLQRITEENREAGARKGLNPSLQGELFCPGRAWLQYGSPWTVYPEAVMMARSRRQALDSLTTEDQTDGGNEAVRKAPDHASH